MKDKDLRIEGEMQILGKFSEANLKTRNSTGKLMEANDRRAD